MIKYTKEIKLYKSKFKEILLRLLKHGDALAKYKSHIVLAILVGVASYVLGHMITYNEDLTWVYHNRDSTKKIVRYSAELYDVQRRLTLNYSNATTLMIDCFVYNPQSCNREEVLSKLNVTANERDKAVTEMHQLESKTSNLLKEMGFEQ